MRAERAVLRLLARGYRAVSPISFIYPLHTFQPADQARGSRHSMAALQPAMSWDVLHHVHESSPNCRSSLT